MTRRQREATQKKAVWFAEISTLNAPLRFDSPLPKKGLINSPQMRDTTASCRGFIHAADVR
ncbi:hypothetical protein XcodCFBP4690_20240 [Xanthomonas codiaei]|uniref:Uncharacterized protein n=1 Tax=Xanthomonas codiaei TaxID=56463 RepID=A0A2S7C9U8_9XANT|nr:hypothetical protein XcodCFBP4690_20240 [Xanthomonas codiaei]